MSDWTARLEGLLNENPARPAEQTIRAIVDLAFEAGEPACEAWLRNRPALLAHAPRLRQAYYDYIIGMETDALGRLLAEPPGGHRPFREVAGPEAMMAYRRVEGMFDQVDTASCRRFVMVGCGQLPVTAIQALERCPNATVVALDPDARAIDAVGRLREIFGWDRLHPVRVDGSDFDFADADIVYVANMVAPKHRVIARILESAPARARLIVRDPYSLGVFWAERAEPELDRRLSVTGRGPGSRYLSRDLFLGR
jgi:hypothetical protein